MRSTIDRMMRQLRHAAPSPLACLTDEQLLRAYEAARDGRAEPEDVRATMQRQPPHPALAQWRDDEVLDAVKTLYGEDE